MRNERMAEAWDRTLPDDTVKDRMLEAIREASRTGGTSAKKKTRVRSILAAAACLALILAVAGIAGVRAGRRSPGEYTAALEGGDTVRFVQVKGDRALSLVIDGPVVTRELTEEECAGVFGELAPRVTAEGTFREDTGELVRLEGHLGDTKVICAAAGIPLTDTLPVGEEFSSLIGDVPVTSGYFITKANSRGEKTAVFFSGYEQEGVRVFLELAGEAGEAEELARRLAETERLLIGIRLWDLSQVRRAEDGTSQSASAPSLTAEIRMNRIVSEMSAAFPYYAPEEYDFVPMDLSALSAYFGKDFTELASLPSYKTDGGYEAEFVRKKGGDIVSDIARIVYENGENTVTIFLSKKMLPYDCIYVYDNQQKSDVNGVPVLFGESADGTFAVADFAADGVFCRVEMRGKPDSALMAGCAAELAR